MGARRTILLALTLFTTGCGSGLVRLTGQLEENGRPVALGGGETVQLDFASPDDALRPLILGVYAKPDGSFAADMNDGTGTGLPPGKYTVKLNREGTHLTRNSALSLFKGGHTVEVTHGGSVHLKVDLATGVISP